MTAPNARADMTAAEIAAQMFQIDPAEMGLPVQGTSLTYANLEQRNARKVQVTFLPWITRLESFLTGVLPRPQLQRRSRIGHRREDDDGQLRRLLLDGDFGQSPLPEHGRRVDF